MSGTLEIVAVAKKSGRKRIRTDPLTPRMAIRDSFCRPHRTDAAWPCRRRTASSRRVLISRIPGILAMIGSSGDQSLDIEQRHFAQRFDDAQRFPRTGNRRRCDPQVFRTDAETCRLAVFGSRRSRYRDVPLAAGQRRPSFAAPVPTIFAGMMFIAGEPMKRRRTGLPGARRVRAAGRPARYGRPRARRCGRRASSPRPGRG